MALWSPFFISGNWLYPSLPRSHFQSYNWSAHLVEKPEAYIVEAVLPGLSKSDVNIEYGVDRFLRISVDREVKNEKSQIKQAFMEEIYIPVDGDLEGEINATMKNGILRVNIPRIAKANTKRRILIN